MQWHWAGTGLAWICINLPIRNPVNHGSESFGRLRIWFNMDLSNFSDSRSNLAWIRVLLLIWIRLAWIRVILPILDPLQDGFVSFWHLAQVQHSSVSFGRLLIRFFMDLYHSADSKSTIILPNQNPHFSSRSEQGMSSTNWDKLRNS